MERFPPGINKNLVHPVFVCVMVESSRKGTLQMQDKNLYQHILGLQSPWSVSEVKLDMESQEIRVRVEHPRGTKFGCPDCQQQVSCYDHGEERQWRHLDSCQFKTILTARVPRVECPPHGVKSVIVPRASPNSRFTMLFERFAIDVLKMTQTVKERLSNIVTFCTHGITNGVAEGINSKIMSIKRRAGGYRNIENFKKEIFF